MEQVPEKFLNRDGSVNTDALVKSYTELEKKIGRMVSVPADNSDADTRAKFNRAIGVPDDASQYPTHPIFDDEDLRAKFLEIGLTCPQVEQIYNIAQEFLMPVVSDLFNVQSETDARNELKSFFGSTEKMHDALRAINAFGEKFLPADAFSELSKSARGIQSMYKMMQSMEPNVQTTHDVAKPMSDADLRRMMQDPKYWRDHDAEYVRKIENGFRKLYS